MREAAVLDRTSYWTSEGASVYPLTAHYVQHQSSYAHLYEHLATDLSSKGHGEKRKSKENNHFRAKVLGKVKNNTKT